MSGYLLKPAQKQADCVIDWTEGYLEPDEVVQDDLGWSLQPAGGAGDIVIETQGIDALRSFARMAKGVPGRVYMASVRARTNRGRHLERAVVVRVPEMAD